MDNFELVVFCFICLLMFWPFLAWVWQLAKNKLKRGEMVYLLRLVAALSRARLLFAYCTEAGRGMFFFTREKGKENKQCQQNAIGVVLSPPTPGLSECRMTFSGKCKSLCSRKFRWWSTVFINGFLFLLRKGGRERRRIFISRTNSTKLFLAIEIRIWSLDSFYFCPAVKPQRILVSTVSEILFLQCGFLPDNLRFGDHSDPKYAGIQP